MRQTEGVRALAIALVGAVILSGCGGGPPLDEVLKEHDGKRRVASNLCAAEADDLGGRDLDVLALCEAELTVDLLLRDKKISKDEAKRLVEEARERYPDVER